MRSSSLLIAALLALAAACQGHLPESIEVVVTSSGAPLDGAYVWVEGGHAETVRTDAAGVARLPRPAGDRATIVVLVIGEDRQVVASKKLSLAEGSAGVCFMLGSDFVPVPVAWSYEHLQQTRPGGAASRCFTDLPELARDRQVDAVVEIDRVKGIPQLPLRVETAGGTVDLAGILREVGITATIVWSDELGRDLLGDEMWPGIDLLREQMCQHRNVVPPPDAWHLYLLLVPQQAPDVELSMLIDPERRAGAVVQIPATPPHPGAVLHALGHEIGHLLNLPHPWEWGEDTPSLMSYPWRWGGWDWEDPRAYRFDETSRRFILRAPEELVRPGRSPFLSWAQE